jgi:HAD superfamily hydrolase (TIGR01509 family)
MKTILVDAIGAFVIKSHGMYQEMYDLLEKYPNRKIVLTGANEEQFKEFKLDKLPYEVFTLKHNPDKVDPVYFEKMLEHFNLKAEDCIYFEHNLEAMRSAESVGIKSYFYDEQKKDIDSLKAFLNSNI